MKILLLIICGGQDGGDGGRLYRKMFEMQKQYWFSHPHIDTYTVQMNPELEQDIIVNDNNNILVKGNENLLNVLYKTTKSLELLTDCGKSNKYDYIVRSNVSTVIDFDRLYDYCKLKKQIYILEVECYILNGLIKSVVLMMKHISGRPLSRDVLL